MAKDKYSMENEQKFTRQKPRIVIPSEGRDLCAKLTSP
jgi:hypothetical protein